MGIFTHGTGDTPNSDSKITPDKLNKVLADTDLAKLRHILSSLSDKHDLSFLDLSKIASKEEDINIPTSIYHNKKLSMLEATVKYIKEELNLRYSNIGRLLNRDERTIWATYSKAQKKSPKVLEIKDSITIPISILSNRTYSILESAIGFLREEIGLKFSQIAKMLLLDDRTIWTCYNRLTKKRNGENEAR